MLLIQFMLHEIFQKLSFKQEYLPILSDEGENVLEKLDRLLSFAIISFAAGIVALTNCHIPCLQPLCYYRLCMSYART